MEQGQKYPTNHKQRLEYQPGVRLGMKAAFQAIRELFQKEKLQHRYQAEQQLIKLKLTIQRFHKLQEAHRILQLRDPM